VNRFALAISIGLFSSSLVLAADPLDGLDTAVAKGLKAHNVAGVSIAVVRNGKLVHAKGYGVKTIGQSDPVTEHSIYAIGSISKSFTATALAMLVEEGKLKWDDPLSKCVKNFRLGDPYLSQEVTIRDALCHRVGFARNELVWYGAPFNREQVVQKLVHLKPEIPLRTGFRYNNMMYLAAGQAIPQATGKSWDDFIADRIFQPLRMETACTSICNFDCDWDLATPHEKVKGKPTPVDWKNADNIGPAGSINASVLDMAEYLKFHLSGGRAHGKQLLSRDLCSSLIRPQMLMPTPALSLNPEAISHAYGLGFMLSDFKGKPMAEHGGNIDGMSAQIGMIPSEKLGVVILTNGGQSLLQMALMYDLFDRFTGEPNPNRAATTGLLAWMSDTAITQLSEPNEKTRVKDTKPSLAIRKYAGTYQDEKHAPMTITADGEKLSGTFNGYTFDLSHWHFDTFLAKDRKGVLPGIPVTFVLGSDGKVDEVRFQFSGDMKLPKKGG
jgi:CubicO group peptidase (beta-lactamase class C family)